MFCEYKELFTLYIIIDDCQDITRKIKAVMFRTAILDIIKHQKHFSMLKGIFVHELYQLLCSC